MANTLLEKFDYKIDQTSFGTWRRYGYPTGPVRDRLFQIPADPAIPVQIK